MKNTIKYLTVLFLFPLACMCSKNEVANPSSEDTDKSKSEEVTVKAVVPDTKVSFAQGENKLTLSWSEGDALMVVGNTSEVYNILPGFSGHKAEFSGKAVEGDNYTVYFPASYANAEALKARSYTGQIQNGNGSLTHLEYNAIVSDLSDYSTINFGTEGALCNGVLKLVVKLPNNVTSVSSITLSAEDELFYTTNGTDSKASSLSLGLEDCTIGNDHILTAYMMTSWQNVTIAGGTKLTLKVTVPDKGSYYTKTFHNQNDLPLNGGGCLNIDISEATVLNHTLAGSGTESNPYQLWDADDMAVIRNQYLKPLQKVYFKMMEDIDMSSISNWMPLNDANVKSGEVECAYEIDLDGDNHTISNLTCLNRPYASLCGVLVGECRNITFKNCNVEQKTAGSSCAVVAGSAGQGASRPASIKNITIEGCTVNFNNTTASACAGICVGITNYAAIENVNIDSNSSVSLTTSAAASAQHIGGVVGYIYSNQGIVKNSRCDATIANNVNLDNTNSTTGGIIGCIANSTTGHIIEKCTFNGSLKSVKTRNLGGIVGLAYATSCKITNCSNYADIDVAEKQIQQVGGIVGYFQGGEISNCFNLGNISAFSSFGGICGIFIGGTISKCFNKGNVSGTSILGGICGNFKATSTSVMEYCYSTGNISVSLQIGGGLVGDIGSNCSMKYCFSTGAVSGNRGLGGVVARAGNCNWVAAGAGYNNEILSCHAYNTSVKSTQITLGGGSGTLIGFAGTKNTYTGCYRHPDFGNNDANQTKFIFGNEPNAIPVDQGDVTPSSPLSIGIVGTSSAKGAITMQYAYPYHGNVAPSDCTTMTLLATKLGWDTSIWNIVPGSNYPTLKDTPEAVK